MQGSSQTGICLLTNQYEPIDSYRPIGVLSLIVAIVVIGIFFLFPQKTADPSINPTVVVEPIQTPIGDK